MSNRGLGTRRKFQESLARELAEIQNDKDMYQIPEEIQKDLDKKGLVGRFINAKKYQDNYGQHRSGWKVYKYEVDKSKKTGSLDFVGGVDSEGYVRRLDSVLAVMKQEDFAKLKRRKELMNLMQADATEVQAEKLNEVIRREGIDAEAIKGYEKN